MYAFCKGLLSLKENFFVPVWDTMEDLRHDGISIGNVSRTVSKKSFSTKLQYTNRKCSKQYFGLFYNSFKHNTEEDALIYKREEQGLISSYVNHVCIFYSSILKTLAKFTEIDGIPFKSISLRAQLKK